MGRDSLFCEVNPYLAWVADVKVNRSRAAYRKGAAADLEELALRLRRRIRTARGDHPLLEADAQRAFFPSGVADQVVAALGLATNMCSTEAVPLARLAIATALIPASNMIRRTDLRRRRAGDPPPHPFLPLVVENLRMIADDVRVVGPHLDGTATRVADDVRRLPVLERAVDLIVTSPPYLNGTNYCRNTKLELLALGLLSDETALADLRLDSIAAGINNVSSRPRRARRHRVRRGGGRGSRRGRVRPSHSHHGPHVLLRHAPLFAAVRATARPGARWLLDIGDSRFCGIHVPTHELLCDVASRGGWVHVSTETIRMRRSYDGSLLTQVLLELRAA